MIIIKMCGIVGILSKKRENVVPLVESMLSSIACRGPDAAHPGQSIIEKSFF